MENNEINNRFKKIEEYADYLAKTLNRTIDYSEYLAERLNEMTSFYNGIKRAAGSIQDPEITYKIPSFEEYIEKKDSKFIKIQDDFFKQFMEEYCKESKKEKDIFIRFTDHMIKFFGFSRIDGYPMCQVMFLINPDVEPDLELGKNVMDFKYSDIYRLEDDIIKNDEQNAF